MPISMPPHIMFRLVLAKTLFKNGIEYCNTKVDVYNFSHGLIALHDALDNFTGAIATLLNITFPQESKFIQTLNLIQENEKKTNASFSLTSRNELVQLNTIRNNIKHQGITPNIENTKTLLGPIILFFKKYSSHYFQLEWDTISLADLIKKDDVRTTLKAVEKLIDSSKYKEALDQMAIIKFQVFDESLMGIRLRDRFDFEPPSEEIKKLRKSNNIFPKDGDGWFSDLYNRADFLEKGIDHNLMKKFEDFTAKVGINNVKEWKYVLKHNHNWGALNWTREISIFCFDFLVDAILKHQGRDYAVKQEWIWEHCRIQAENDIKIYNKDDQLIHTIPKDKERDALFLGRKAGEWEIFDISDLFVKLHAENGEPEISGYFKKSDIEKIKFLKIECFTKNEDDEWVLVNEIKIQ